MSGRTSGQLMLMKELAAELGPYGIRVNAVSPGAIDTVSDRIRDAEEHIEESRALVPLRRLGEPGDVAKVVEFLLDPDRSGYITGADVAVDGGLDQFNWLHHRYGSAAAEQARVDPGSQGSGQEPDAASRCRGVAVTPGEHAGPGVPGVFRALGPLR